MRLQALVVLVLALCVSARPRRRESNPMPQPEGDCDMLQPFEQDHIYVYKYIANTQHRDSTTDTGNDVKITCTATITVPRRCSGILRVSECRVEGGKLQMDGSVDYHTLDTSAKFDREMGVNDMAFHFNGGQITRIFVDKQERTNVTNFKRGILASFQAFNPDLPKDFQVGDVYNVPRMNVYGEGMVQHKIISKNAHYPTVVEITRDATKIKLPWERRQWNFLRMRNNRQNPILSAFKNFLTINDEDMWMKSKQTCRYTLRRGRQVGRVSCVENYPLNPEQPYLLRYLLEKNPIQTTIHQDVQYRTSRKMTDSDLRQWDVARFDEDNIMFEEEWEETNIVFISGFDAEKTFLYLVREVANNKTTALVSKLSRWMAIASQEDIEKVWKKCEKECNPEEKSAGRLLWLELLNSCVASDWCEIPYCSTENSTACENALESFVKRNVDESPEVKEACMTSLESIYAPSEGIVNSALRICRLEESRITPRCVRSLGKVTKNFLETCKSDCDSKKPIVNAKRFLLERLNSNCETSDEETGNVMAEAVEWIGRFGSDGRYAQSTVLACATNHAPALVTMKSLVAYGNITEETLPRPTVKKLIRVFTNAEKVETRITSFHLLMKKNLETEDVEAILSKVMNKSEHFAVRQHCLEDLRTQLRLRGTMFCQFNKDVAEKCVEVIRRHEWDIGVDAKVLASKPVEKNMEIKRDVYLPVFDTVSKCFIQIKSVYETDKDLVPIMSKLTVLTNIEGRNVSVVEAAIDISGMKPVLNKIFGHDTFYSQMLSKLLSTPISELHGYAEKYPALNALRAEGRYAYVQNAFDVRSPIYLKVLGYEISFDSLMGLDTIRRLALGNFHEIVAAIEAGFEHEIFVVGQPFLMQHAVPTSLGAPMISTIDFSYYMKNKLNIKANLGKMLVTPNEKGVFNVAPEIHVTGIVTHTVLAQFTDSCGTELKFGFGHGSAFDCTFDRTPEGFSTACAPKQDKAQLLYINGKKSLAGPDASSPDEMTCYDYQMTDMFTVSYCQRKFTSNGFRYEMYLDNESNIEYRSSFSMLTKSEEQTRAVMNEIKFECTADKRHDASARKVLWSSVINIVPSRREIQCDLTSEAIKWKALGKLLFPRQESLTGLHFDFKSSGTESLDYKYFTSLKITPENANKYVVSGELKWKTASRFDGYLLSGIMEQTTEREDKSRKADFTLSDINDSSQRLLVSSFLAKKVREGLEGMPGYETSYNVEGSLVPQYKKITLRMLTSDSDERYNKILSASGHFDTSEINPHFFVHRLKGTWKRPESENYDAEIRCISNKFIVDYVVKSDSKRDTTISAKVSFPEQPVAYSEIFSDSNPSQYNLKLPSRPVGSYIEGSYNAKTVESGDRDHDIALGYRLWSSSLVEYYEEKATARYTNHTECRYCHTFQFEHPKAYLTSISRMNSTYYHEEKWMKLHYSLLDYVYLRPYIAYYLINNVRNEYVEIGYKGKHSSPKEGGSSKQFKAALLNNAADCLLDFAENEKDWNSVCKLDIPAITLNLDLKLKASNDGENTPKIEVDCKVKYAEVGCNVDGYLLLTRSNNFQGSFNATYGSEGNYEHEDLLKLGFDNNDSTYDITGSYKNTHKPTGKVQEHQLVGTSENRPGSNRDYEIKALCPEDRTKVCGEIGINKGDSLILYKRLVREGEHDLATIKKIGDSSYSLEAKMVNEMLRDAGDIKGDLDLRENHPFGFKFVSRICNMTVYLASGDFEVQNTVSIGWLKYKMMAMIKSDSAKYEFDWDTRHVRGSKLVSAASFNYNVMKSTKPLDARIILGSAPESYKYEIKTSDFNFELSQTRGGKCEKPSMYQYFCDVHALPSKIVINELKLPIFYREIEVKGTSLGYEFRNDRFHGVFVRDLSLSLSRPFAESRPTILQGDSVINWEEVSIKVADTERSFVCEVVYDPDLPGNHHYEFVVTFLNTKLDLLWDMENKTDRIQTTQKCEISAFCWKTKKMYPVLTSRMINTFVRTSESANFPVITMDGVFNHDLLLPFIPKENKFVFTTTISGQRTVLRSTTMIGDTKMVDMTVNWDGCHRRVVPYPGFSYCIPNMMKNTMVIDLPRIVKIEHILSVTKSNDKWEISWNDVIRSPILAKSPVTSTLTTKMQVSSCPSDQGWCVPERIEFTDIEYRLPIIPTIGMMDIFIPSFIESWINEGIHVTRSEILLTCQNVDRTIEHTIVSTIRNDETGEVLVIQFSNTLAANKLKSDLLMTSGDWNLKQVIDVGYDTETWGWHFIHKLKDPSWIESNAKVVASSPFTITVLDMKTTMPHGMIRDFSLVSTDHEIDGKLELVIMGVTGTGTHKCKWDPKTMNWNSENTINCPWMEMDMKMTGTRFWINSCDLTLKTTGWMHDLNINFDEHTATCKCNVGTVEMNMQQRREGVTGSYKSGSYPWANQTVVVNYNGQQSRYDWTTEYSTEYFVCTTRFATNSYAIKGKLMKCDMKKSPAGFKVEYSTNAQGQRYSEIKMTDTYRTTVSCKSTPMANENTQAQLNCFVLKGSETKEFAKIPVSMVDFPFMGDYVILDKALFVVRYVSCYIKALSYNEEMLGKEFQKDLGCSDPKLCYDFAKSVKAMQYQFLKEMRRVSGPATLYLTRPDIAEYALKNLVSFIPGSLAIAPQWSSVNDLSSNSSSALDVLTGGEMKVLQWTVPGIIHLEVKAEVTKTDDIHVSTEYRSAMFPWLNSRHAFAIEKINGESVMKMMSGFSAWKYAAVFRVEGGELYPVADEFCTAGCAKGAIFRYNWTMTEDRRHNFTMLMMRGNEVQFACDLLSRPSDWSNAEIKCYEGLNREAMIGKISLPDWSSTSGMHYYTSLDAILREVLNVESSYHRNKFYSSVNQYAAKVSSYMQDYVGMSKTSKMFYNIAQYGAATLIHGTAKYTGIQEAYDIVRRVMRTDSSDYYQIAQELEDYFNVYYGDSGMWAVARDMASPLFNTLGYVLEGEIYAGYEYKDGALVIRNSVSSTAYPLYNFINTLRIMRRSYRNVVLNHTMANKFVTVGVDAHFDGPRFFVDKIRFGIPGSKNEFIELRMVANQTPGKPYNIEMYFDDVEGYNYGCRGAMPSYQSAIIHMHCFSTDGSDLPPNPPSSKMIAYWDIDIDRIPFASRTDIFSIWDTLVSVFRVINTCAEDWKTVNTMLIDNFHVSDATVRQRLLKTIDYICNKWIEVYTGVEPESERRTSSQPEESTIVSYSRKYKSYSYEMFKSSISKGFDIPVAFPITLPEFTFVGDMVPVVYEFGAPLFHYAYSVVEYLEASGNFEMRRCLSCSAQQRKSRIDFELRANMTCDKHPIFDYDIIFDVDQQGVINASISNGFAWGWIQSQTIGIFVWPKTAKFGLANDRLNGVDVSFWTQRTATDPTTISFFFNCDQEYRCDAELTAWYLSDVHCRPRQARATGQEVATCKVTPISTMRLTSDLAFETLSGEIKQAEKIAVALDQMCTFQDRNFRASVSKTLVKKFEFLISFFRDLLMNTFKTVTDFFDIAHATVWQAIVNSYDWFYESLPIVENVMFSRYFTVTNQLLNGFLSYCESLTMTMHAMFKTVYEIAYVCNSILFNFPSYIPYFGVHDENILQYYQNSYDYLNILGSNFFTGPNCAFGMIHGSEYEQAISLNNYYYYLPRSFRNCSYMLAEEVGQNTFTIVFDNDDIVFNMPKSSVSIKPNLRVLVGRGGSLTETTLPYYSDEVFCVRQGSDLHCHSRYATIIVKTKNNRRSAFYVKVSEVYCPTTRGLMGVGANMTEVPKMLMMNNVVASTMEEFIDSYRVDKSCSIGHVGAEPPMSHEYCDRLFEKEEWINSCSGRRRSFLRACQTSARSLPDACRYAEDLNFMCNIEGRPIKAATECGLCGGSRGKETVIDKVNVNVIMSLTSRTERSRPTPMLQEILDSIRDMANNKHLNYEVTFISFGGQDEMYLPAFDIKNGKISTPSTEAWTIPNLPRNGPSPLYQSIDSTMWFAMMKNKRSGSGEGKIFLFATPEDMDYVLLNSSTAAVFMREDMVRSYLFTPKTCERLGQKSRARYGVRPLFSSDRTVICERTAAEVAEEIAYPDIDKRVSCECRVENPYNGEVFTKCQPEPVVD